MQGTSGLNSRHPFNLYYNAGEYMKICGTQDGYFRISDTMSLTRWAVYGFTRSSCWMASG